MENKHVFEYAVIRIVPKVEREEFINVGVVLFCKSLDYLNLRIQVNVAKLQIFTATEAVGEIAAYLQVFESICLGAKDAGEIASLPKAERFRWLTATRSTVVQCSKVHPGLCTDPESALAHLFAQLVL